MCANCNKQSKNAKRCAGCRNVWYCSTQCQSGHWSTHIFDCKTRKPIDTVYHLYRAACRGLVPQDVPTCVDYGLGKAVKTMDFVAQYALFQVWQEILLNFRVPLKEVRAWRIEGQLIEGVKVSEL